MISVLQQPTVSFQRNGNTFYSNLLAAHNPAIIKLRRADFVVRNILDNGSGKVRVRIEIPPVPNQVTIGSQIYLNVGANWYVNGTWTVTAYNGSDEIDLDLDYTVAPNVTNSSYLNLVYDHKSYFIRARVFKLQPDNTYSLIGSSRLVPFSDGSAIFDLMPYNKLIVQETYRNWVQFPIITALLGGAASYAFPDKYGTGGVMVEFSEEYNGIPSQGDPTALEFLVSNAAMQPTHANGVNITECYQQVSGSSFLQSRFYKPPSKIRYWDCLGVSLNSVFIPLGNMVTFLPNGLDNTQLDAEFRVFSNGITLVNYFKQLPATAYNASSVVDPPIPSSKFGWCVFAALSPNELTAFGAIKPDYFTLRIVDRATHSKAYTETLTVRCSCTPRNPIVVAALNHYGGWTWFVFGKQAAKSLSTQQGSTFSKYSTDSTVIPAESLLMGKSSVSEITVGADDLDDDDLVLIETILTSPIVKVMSVKEDSILSNFYSVNDIQLANSSLEYHDVKVVQGSFTLGNSGSNLHRCEFKIQFTEQNFQTT